MKRRNFLKNSILTMGTLSSLTKLSDSLAQTDVTMPVLFVGHGSPMNAIENNIFSDYWKKLGNKLPKPTAVLCVSAHWLTKGTYITAMQKPKTIHDFGGFPQALFDVQYPAPGDVKLAEETQKLIKDTQVGLDHDWGLDHGTWSVVKQMYPNANIPVLQLSIDFYNKPEFHYNLGKQLTELRKKGVLIIGSGNMIHNLGMLNFPPGSNMANGMTKSHGYEWAFEINDLLKAKIKDRDFKSLVNYQSLHKDILKAVPSPDHYYPMLYTLGLVQKNDDISIFNDKVIGGSLNMTSLIIG